MFKKLWKDITSGWGWALLALEIAIKNRKK